MVWYEDKADRTREQRVADTLQKAWGAVLTKLPSTYALDYLVQKDGQTLGFVEVKCRDMVWGKYPDIMVALKKFIHAHGLEFSSTLPCLYVVEDNNHDIRTFPFIDMQPKWLRYGGRTVMKRPDAVDDVEPVYHIPTHLFTPLAPLPENSRSLVG
jgi:hypothetical protein